MLATALERARALHLGAGMPAEMAGTDMNGDASKNKRYGNFGTLAQATAVTILAPCLAMPPASY